MRRMRHLKPREIQGCQLALDASIPSSLYNATSGGSPVAANGSVYRWEDQSGNGRHATQSTPGSTPLRRVAAINGVDAVDFDGSNDVMALASLAITTFLGSGSDTTVLASFVQDGARAQNVQFNQEPSVGNRLTIAYTYANTLYFDAANTGAGRTSVAQPSGWDDAPQVTMSYRSGANGSIVTNNVTRVTKTTFSGTATGTSAAYIGTTNTSETFGGNMAQIAIWNLGLPEFVRKRATHATMRKLRVNG